eukprot:TRINITY_DN29574_c0_g1_i1.p1 TRINITY_DN29574_c0_g1~~TRINITY_DN29574_c0_g1_i1.p1  ORF type:complete len:192 (-),score=73.93 TRINITY_DN29574_c0_g1_i1:243-818(-)
MKASMVKALDDLGAEAQLQEALQASLDIRRQQEAEDEALRSALQASRLEQEAHATSSSRAASGAVEHAAYELELLLLRASALAAEAEEAALAQAIAASELDARPHAAQRVEKVEEPPPRSWAAAASDGQDLLRLAEARADEIMGADGADWLATDDDWLPLDKHCCSGLDVSQEFSIATPPGSPRFEQWELL